MALDPLITRLGFRATVLTGLYNLAVERQVPQFSSNSATYFFLASLCQPGAPHCQILQATADSIGASTPPDWREVRAFSVGYKPDCAPLPCRLLGALRSKPTSSRQWLCCRCLAADKMSPSASPSRLLLAVLLLCSACLTKVRRVLCCWR
jgi:hypothetical protein